MNINMQEIQQVQGAGAYAGAVQNQPQAAMPEAEKVSWKEIAAVIGSLAALIIGITLGCVFASPLPVLIGLLLATPEILYILKKWEDTFYTNNAEAAPLLQPNNIQVYNAANAA